jgi:hypothetical protein
MKNVLVLGVAALALVGCAKTEEAAVPAETPVVEENVEAAAPEADATAVAPDAPNAVEPGVTTEVKAAE